MKKINNSLKAAMLAADKYREKILSSVGGATMRESEIHVMALATEISRLREEIADKWAKDHKACVPIFKHKTLIALVVDLGARQGLYGRENEREEAAS